MSSLNNMKVVNPNDVSHLIGAIPRYYGFAGAVLTLTNETTKVETEVAYTEQIIAGVMELSFDFDFNEGDKFAIKLSEGTEIVYRGKLFATSQETQNFKNSVNYYSYE